MDNVLTVEGSGMPSFASFGPNAIQTSSIIAAFQTRTIALCFVPGTGGHVNVQR